MLEHGTSLYSYFNGPPELTIPDPRCQDGYHQPWLVHNNADETAGTMNLIDATANSVNTIFAQLVTQVGPPAVVRMAHRLGIQSNLQTVCSITLGTQAVSPLEMATAYSTLADRGIRNDPRAVESVREYRKAGACTAMSFATGWATRESGKFSVESTQVSLNACDRGGVSYMLPLGVMTAEVDLEVLVFESLFLVALGREQVLQEREDLVAQLVVLLAQGFALRPVAVPRASGIGCCCMNRMNSPVCS